MVWTPILARSVLPAMLALCGIACGAQIVSPMDGSDAASDARTTGQPAVADTRPGELPMCPRQGIGSNVLCPAVKPTIVNARATTPYGTIAVDHAWAQVGAGFIRSFQVAFSSDDDFRGGAVPMISLAVPGVFIAIPGTVDGTVRITTCGGTVEAAAAVTITADDVFDSPWASSADRTLLAGNFTANSPDVQADGSFAFDTICTVSVGP